MFSTVAVTRDLPYGRATTQSGTEQTLLLDLYQPSGDPGFDSSVRAAVSFPAPAS